MKYTQSATAAHFCRFISVSVGATFRRFLQYFGFVNDSLSLSNLCVASRAVTGRVLGRSDLSVAGLVSLGFICLSSRGGSYASLDDNDIIMLRARDLARAHRGSVSNLIRISVKVHRSVFTVSVGSKSFARSARNLMTNWTWVAESQFCSEEGGYKSRRLPEITVLLTKSG